MSKLLLTSLTIILLSLWQAVPARASTLPLPNSMAATGDSITRAFDIGWAHVLSDSPQYSWSTGTDSAVNSQYLRILARNPAIGGRAYNDAWTGAKMADLNAQVTVAALQRVQYLTVLMGANDVCTSSVATMTPTSVFATEFLRALTDFSLLDPTAHIYVSSLPNIYQLWSVLHTNPSAESTWQLFGICRSMLSAANTEIQRQQVVAQEQADNFALATICRAFPNCRWDNYAGYNFAFSPADVDTVDYFHPSLAGQRAIAAVTWEASYWGN